jgi:hypothetical protein
VAAVVLAALPAVFPDGHRAASRLPAQLADDEFWRLVNTFSEDDGYFRSDNFLSNEIGFQRVIPALLTSAGPGGAYLGVGPEQNFTYLVALKPEIAFIIDIRRQNMVQHLLYKALIEMSAGRVEFLSRLFSREMTRPVTRDVTVDRLFQAISEARPRDTLFRNNLRLVHDRLTRHHGFALTAEDAERLEYVYNAFYTAGPELEYSFGAGGGAGFGRGWMPTYTDLMIATDGEGQHRGYLASEENFLVLKRLEEKNLVVPIVGDFAGPTALRSVARYLTENGATVTAFYTSNVEQYLFQGDQWQRFYANVSALPVDRRSIFIRSVSRRWFAGTTPGRATTLLCPMAYLLTSYNQGDIRSYADVIARSK